ncbi:Oidioi.mRNA.OKI2018_I69.XSR.g14882.t1.cds [Oikopleura dioica]|uniref:Oidioi.mRNA.OKI2018_I69.XSR.g14882.t1.cds n=1 Tax=Oikopleura dioica TaxID=34765 RepID=A0ABN7SBK3_OIKDI|nr:Oidioi.mRNA.OKI2018_I69.XSR.g14882.t1.cds [Oikopleura dioica]
MDFREKVKNVINKSRLIKAFSTRLKTQEETRKHPLTRSQSARLSSERLPRRHRPGLNLPSTESNDFQRAVTAIHLGSVVQLRRVLQYNELSDKTHRFAINGYDELGRTLAIHFAQKCPRKNALQMIEVLSEFSVDFDLGTKSEGVTPLMLAAQRFDLDVFIPAILAAGADPTICDYNGETVLHWLEAGGIEDEQEQFEKKRSSIRRVLINSGAKPTTKNSKGITSGDIRAKWPKRPVLYDFSCDEQSDEEDYIGTLKRRKNHSETGSTGVPGPSLLGQQSEQQFHGVIYDELDYYMTRLQEEIGLF